MSDKIDENSCDDNLSNVRAQKHRDQLILDNVDYVARILSTMTFIASSDEVSREPSFCWSAGAGRGGQWV